MKKWIALLFVFTGLIWLINIKSIIKEGKASSDISPSALVIPQYASVSPSPRPSTQPPVLVKNPSGFALLPPQKFIYQTFNNCGPATLSMLLDFYGIKTSQQEIADKLRPFQQIRGIGDDKSVSLDELSSYAKEHNLITYKRPNGDINKLKSFLENGIPVLTITWLNREGGFGHYRIIKGYDDKNNQITEDDSIFGLNQHFSYDEFLKDWQFFNYQYLIIVPSDQKDLVEAIFKDEKDIQLSYKNALARAQTEYQKDPSNILSLFNQSTSNYYLGNFDQSTKDFEQGQNKFPYRLLWYQYEPVLSYQKLKNYPKVFQLINFIFQNGDIASSELYLIRGEVYLDQGKKVEAKKEFELALYYNKNYTPAQQALNQLSP